MLFAQARAECGEQLLGGHVQFIAQVFSRLFDFAEIIAVGLDQVADAFDRIGLEARALVAVGHLRCDQSLAAARFCVGGVQPLQRVSYPGAQFRQVAQFLFRQVDLPEQRIGKYLVQLGEKPVLVGGGEIAQIEIIGLRQPQQDLRRHRALIALNQVVIAWRNAEALSHLGLRQAQLLTNPPKAGADKQFFSGVTSHGSLADWSPGSDGIRIGPSILYFDAFPARPTSLETLSCDKNYNMTSMTCPYV